MPVRKLKEFLDANRVKYISIRHSQAFTAQEVAQSAHVSGRIMAKTIIIETDGQLAMAVLPANQRLSLEDLREMTGLRHATLAPENKFKDRFPDCETGAMPPFGNLYNMEVFVAGLLADNDEIAFNGGTHDEVIKLPYADFERLVKPKVFDFVA